MAYDDRDYYRGDDDTGDGFGGGSGGGFGPTSGGGGGGASGGGWFHTVLRWLNMTFPLGTYVGIAVRLHITFFFALIFFLGVFGLSFHTLQITALLFLCVLLHEFGHCFGCRAVGGQADRILMWPLGGLAMCAPPRRPWPEFVTVACGPGVNLVLGAATYLGLYAWHGGASPASLNPFAPIPVDDFHSYGRIDAMLAMAFAVNYTLLLFNLALIFYPFDGGRLVQIAVWKLTDYPTSMRWAVRLGMAGAVLVALVGLAYHNLMLVFIAVFGFLACYQQGKMITAGGEDEPWRASLYEPGHDGGGAALRWRARRDAKRRAREAEARAREDMEIDRILAKVKDQGVQSLSAKEKRTLKRATDRQRRTG